MSTAYHRKKQPEAVRRALLDQATRLAAEEGIAAVTMQAVAEAAGVTKGGLTHHFPNKQSLVTAIFTDLLDGLERRLQDRIAGDPVSHGSFSRAYVAEIIDLQPSEKGGLWASLSILMLSDPRLKVLWAERFNGWLEAARETDDTLDLTIIRMAADGIWLSDFYELPVADRHALKDRLFAMTCAK